MFVYETNPSTFKQAEGIAKNPIDFQNYKFRPSSLGHKYENQNQNNRPNKLRPRNASC
jgi:hypothetical protein